MVIFGAVVPVPLSATVWGLPDASSSIRRLALRAPAAVGVNRTCTVQLPLGATTAGVHVSFWASKSPGSVPASVRAVTVSGPLPVFVTVTVLHPLAEPTGVSPKPRLERTETRGAATAVPESATDCGVFDASSAKRRLAERAPVPEAANATPT